MAKRTIHIDLETATLEDMRRVGEQIARADQGVPLWQVLGEPKPTPLPEITFERLMAHAVGRGGAD